MTYNDYIRLAIDIQVNEIQPCDLNSLLLITYYTIYKPGGIESGRGLFCHNLAMEFGPPILKKKICVIMNDNVIK